MFTVGVCTTVSVVVVELKHPNGLVPVILYTVVVLGLAFTFDPLAELKVATGDHV